MQNQRLKEEEYKQRAKSIANALDLDFLEFEELEVDYLKKMNMYVTGLDIDFLEQNFLADILKQINEELAIQMSDEFKKQKRTGAVIFGRDEETGVIILDEDTDYVWIREGISGAYIELRLDQQYGYILNIIQDEFEMYDFQLGGQDNEITIYQGG